MEGVIICNNKQLQNLYRLPTLFVAEEECTGKSSIQSCIQSVAGQKTIKVAV